MKQFFATIKNLHLADFDIESFEFMPGLNISKSTKIKESILTIKNKEIIGIIETFFFENNNCFFHLEFEDDEEAFEGSSNLEILETLLNWIDDVLKNSWLIKDNCIITDTAYLISELNDSTQASSLRLEYQLTNSRGIAQEVTFSKAEIEEFERYHDRIEKYLYGKDSGTLKFMLNKNFSRMGRTLLFIKQAREARNLAYKISNYCSAFETLFSTDSSELSHKLSERIAFFLFPEFNKLETFKKMKKAYLVRSKLTHGATLEQKQIDLLGDLSENIDTMLRFILNKIMRDEKLLSVFDSDNTKVDVYFEELILG
jgi:hypothetical protein